MSDATTYLKNALAQHALGGTPYTQPSSYSIGLFTADPTDAGSLANEVSGGGYARQALVFSITGNTAENSAQREFPLATANWGIITHVGIFDGSGNMLLHPALPTAKEILTDDILRFAAGEITATIGS